MAIARVHKPVQPAKDTRCVTCMSRETHCMGKFYWCEACGETRAKLLAWGQKRGYPDLKLGYYAIGPGEFCWEVACLLGNEELIAVALLYIEMLEADDTEGLEDDAG